MCVCVCGGGGGGGISHCITEVQTSQLTRFGRVTHGSRPLLTISRQLALNLTLFSQNLVCENFDPKLKMKFIFLSCQLH